MPRKTGRSHSHRDKYRKPPTKPRDEDADRVWDRDYAGKRIRSKGKFETKKDRITRRLENAKEKRLKK